MAFCPSCGAAVEGNFCSACGKSVGGASGAAPAAAGMQDNVAGALCYVLGLITGILFLVLEPYSRNREIRFHAFQSIFLSIAWIAVWIALTTMGSIIPLLGALIFGGLSLVIGLGFLVLWILLMIKTYGGSKMVLPVIGPIAQKQAG